MQMAKARKQSKFSLMFVSCDQIKHSSRIETTYTSFPWYTVKQLDALYGDVLFCRRYNIRGRRRKKDEAVWKKPFSSSILSALSLVIGWNCWAKTTLAPCINEIICWKLYISLLKFPQIYQILQRRQRSREFFARHLSFKLHYMILTHF